MNGVEFFFSLSLSSLTGEEGNDAATEFLASTFKLGRREKKKDFNLEINALYSISVVDLRPHDFSFSLSLSLSSSCHSSQSLPLSSYFAFVSEEEGFKGDVSSSSSSSFSTREESEATPLNSFMNI